MNNKTTLVLIILVFIGSYIFISQESSPPITSYDECVAAGHLVMESYPEQCSSGKKTFTRNIGNELELTDHIMVDSPRPGNIITSPLIISGQARGTWYFEASFPIKLLDENGEIVVQSFAAAEGEWMTEEFVPFTSTLVFTPSGSNLPGKLILQKDNPSDIRELDNQLEIPVRY